ncbi:hypothetical protein BV898_14712 [Hypsibius exemplaris]|uniref:Uncharacterized protein n=1 Tax=Hypsibius exemplaris TaxID=2072580 RepID=A0A9X6N9E8_HYPEX|nr:hypothetical protein BV898_14712 [Hypsibius exemplaris]
MRSCLCCSLYNGCKWVAGYQFVSACLGIVGIIYSIASGETKDPGMRALEIVLTVVVLALAVGLVFALKRNNRGLLLIWIIVKAILLTLVVLSLIYIIYLIVISSTIDLDVYTSNEESRKLFREMNATLAIARTVLIFYMVLIILHVILEAICLDTVRSYRSTLGQEGRNNGFQVAYHAPPEDSKRDQGLV